MRFTLLRFDRSSFLSGATKKIVARDSKSFGIEIAKYIDSKDRKGKDKKDKGKDKDKKKDKAKDPNTPALWPLIRQVNVRCSAAALATGAVLVDLPGECGNLLFFISLTFRQVPETPTPREVRSFHFRNNNNRSFC